jgi:hypothetical protein
MAPASHPPSAIPQILAKNQTGTRQDASPAGNVGGDNAAESRDESRRHREQTGLVLGHDEPCQHRSLAHRCGEDRVEATRMINSQPQNSPLTKALQSSAQSMSAPRAGVMPRSLQRATR